MEKNTHIKKEYELRKSANGAKLFYCNGKRIARDQVPQDVQDSLILCTTPDLTLLSISHSNGQSVSWKSIHSNSQINTNTKKGRKAMCKVNAELMRRFSPYIPGTISITPSYISNVISRDLQIALLLYLDISDIERFQRIWELRHLTQEKYFWLQKARNSSLLPDDVLREQTIKDLKTLTNNPICNKEEALCVAAKYGNIEEVKLLLQEGATDINSAFSQACANGHFQLVKFLICQGSVNINNGIRLALAYKNLPIAKFLLLEYQQNVDIDLLKVDIIETAAQINDSELIDIMSKNYGVNTNSMLYLVSRYESIDLVKYLFNIGATDVETALMNARTYKSFTVLEYLTARKSQNT
jgi:hypothetical protein